MNILIIAPPAYTVSAKTGGSVEISIYETAKRVAERHDVTIISRKSKHYPNSTKDGNLTIKRIESEPGYLSGVIQYIKTRQFDCIQVENRPQYIPVLRSFFPRQTLILVLHSLTFMTTLPKKERRDVIKKATVVICNSHFIRKHYAKEFPRYSKKIINIHLGVDLSRFRAPNLLEKEIALARYSLTNSYNILYTGRIIPKKGVHVLVEATGIVKQKIPSVRLILVGRCSKPYKQFLKQTAKKSGVDIRFLGKVSPADIHQIYWLGDCFVCPTQFKEAFGLVNVEAMASGLPVVASKRGGIPEIINPQNGILVRDYTNPQEFAKAIEKLILTPSLADTLAAEAQLTVHNHFDWAMAAARYEEIYVKFGERHQSERPTAAELEP
ncbi:glycosyltransferase family 4 protein [Brevibacillus massiliensis]|uniref:glycosyltransferase family 4 protein n=1 Tax=Brevibacillus massiliensis TaxID=1118054 RepID=UPI0002F1940C|nr:glycosyltransferase family 4 protein [Brevibacillus massiliensis]